MASVYGQQRASVGDPCCFKGEVKEHEHYISISERFISISNRFIGLSAFSNSSGTHTLSILCWDLRHTLRRHRQGPFVEQTDFNLVPSVTLYNLMHLLSLGNQIITSSFLKIIRNVSLNFLRFLNFRIFSSLCLNKSNFMLPRNYAI
jgi:hypothetical protein